MSTTNTWVISDSWTMTRRELAHWQRQPVQVVIGLVFPVMLLLLLRFAMLWLGIHLAMVAGKPEMVQAVQILVWPIGFFSNAFATPESMPGWLGAAVEWNPLSTTAAAVRDLAGVPGQLSGSWAAEHAHLLAVVWPVALIALFFPLAVGRFRGLSR